MNLARLERVVADAVKARGAVSLDALRDELHRTFAPSDEVRLAADSAGIVDQRVGLDSTDPNPWY